MANLTKIPFTEINFEDGFWKSRSKLNKSVSIPSIYARFEETGRFDALRFNYKEGKPPLHIFYDSDVAKWIESVSYEIMKNPEACKDEQTVIDALVKDMEKNQREDGYLNSYFQQIEPNEVFKRRSDHELYCAGHLIEGAIAYDKATKKSGFLNVVKRYIDCIERAFITQKTAAFTTCGHEEIELALIKLYDYTGEKKYLDMASFFVDSRGASGEVCVLPTIVNRKYDQSEMPVRELKKVEGHAVRATYLFIAMCNLAIRTGDKELKAACERLFDDIISSKMYITGGIGSSANGECFTVPYDLPNLEAYAESCGAIGFILFAHAMQGFGINKKYADTIERIMYNSLLSSTSLDGKSFFYQNPLEVHIATAERETSILPGAKKMLPPRVRSEVFSCSCCPPNITRTIARIGDFFFAEEGDTFVINQYAPLTLDSEKIKLKMTGEYATQGKVSISFTACEYASVYMRVPEWCDSFTVSVPHKEKDGYIVLDGRVSEVDIDFNIHTYFVEANPSVRENTGRVALCYGPTVYCIESIDNGGDLNALAVDTNGSVSIDLNTEYTFPNLVVDGYRKNSFSGLYRKATAQNTPVKINFRPYWTFANRGEADMLVWVRKA